MCQFLRQLCGHHRKAPRSSDRSSDSSTNITHKKNIILDNFKKSWAIAFIVFLDSKTKLMSYFKKFQITIWFAHSFWIWKTYFSIAKPHIIFGQEWYKPKIYQKRMNNRETCSFTFLLYICIRTWSKPTNTPNPSTPISSELTWIWTTHKRPSCWIVHWFSEYWVFFSCISISLTECCYYRFLKMP